MPKEPIDIELLISTRDTLSLLRLLRTHPDPVVREQVARRLAELDSPEIVEGLIRSTKLDPDAQVKRSAKASLERVLGQTASEAIKAYGDIQESDREFENALLAADGQEMHSGEGGNEDYAPEVMSALETGDVEELHNYLSASASNNLRAQAAEALGELKHDSSIEYLIRAIKADPDEFVRKVAGETLHAFLDPNTAAAAVAAYKDFDIQAYQANLSNQAHPALDDRPGEEDLDPYTPALDPYLSVDHVSVLVSIVGDDRHPERQIKAINFLTGKPTLEGNDAIAMAALWSENAIVRQHAMSTLASMYGEELETYLANFKQSTGTQEPSEEIDAEVDADKEEENQTNPQSPAYPQFVNQSNLPSTHHEERSFNPFQLVLIIGIILLLILVVRYFLAP